MSQPPRGESREVAIGAKSDLTNTFVPLEANPSTKALKVDLADSLAPKTAAIDFEGAPVTVGTSEVEMTFSGTTTSIMIQSDPDNTGKIWIGKTGITNSGGNAMVQLEPGDALSLDLNDTSAAIFAISDTATQNVHKFATL